VDATSAVTVDARCVGVAQGRGVAAGEARAREGEMCLVAVAIGRDGEAEGGVRLL